MSIRFLYHSRGKDTVFILSEQNFIRLKIYWFNVQGLIFGTDFTDYTAFPFCCDYLQAQKGKEWLNGRLSNLLYPLLL